jgi:hypothetical protein
MFFGWSTHGKLACPYCMENNKNFTLINDGKTFFFIVIRGSCLVIIDTEKKKDFPKGKTKKDVAPLIMSGGELYDVVLQYKDIVFGSQSGKQKFSSFGVIHNWVKQNIFLRASLLEYKFPPP